MIAIENKEVKGVTTRFILWLLISTVTIVGSVVMGYAKIISFMEKNQMSNELQQIQIDTIKIEQKTTNGAIQTLDIRLSRLEERINDLKANR